MLILTVASVISLAAVQNSAASAARTTFGECVRAAAADAKKKEVPLEGLVAHLRQSCAADADKLRTTLVSFDVKNGVKKAQANEDAELQLQDYYAAQEERYRYEVAARKPKAPVQAAAAPTTPAAPATAK
jgi:CRISPR/Cas system-associated exonuclease Cas4 (RecB family)